MSGASVFKIVPEGGPAPTEPRNETELFPAPSNPMAVARVLLDELMDEGQHLLRRWRGGWMRYSGPQWVEDEDGAVRKWVYARLEHVSYEKLNPKTQLYEITPWNPNRSKVADLLDAMAGIVLLDSTVDTPSWLDTGEPAGQFIACPNGLLDVRDQKLHPITPRYFGTVAVPFDYDPDAPEPVEWLKFLRSIWPVHIADEHDQPVDADEIQSLHEWAGYVLSGRTDLHKILLLVGPPRSGKGTITRILERLVGKGNYCSPTLAGLGTNFGLQPLLGKVLATVADARLGRDNTNVVVERLLSISGEDTLTVDRKHREAWSGKIPARLMICSNELPRFTDASGAIASRFVVLAMQQTFLGNEDTELEARIVAELPGILRWALAGLVRLNRKKHLTVPAASTDMMSMLADLVSPMGAFVREVCVRGPDESVVVDDIYRQWNIWATENGHNFSTSKAKSSSDLRSVVPTLQNSRPHGQARQWRGISVSREWLQRPRDQHERWAGAQ